MDIRNGSITAYNGISASLGTSNQFNINKSGTNYLNVFNNGRLWIGSGTPTDSGFQADIVGTVRVNGTLTINTSGQSTTLSTFYGIGSQGQNIFIGGGGLSSGTGGGSSAFGSYNTAVGITALSANTTGNLNTAIGTAALIVNTTGNNNAAFANSSLQANISGINNTGIGVSTLFSNTTGNNNTSLGFQAGYGLAGTNSNTTGTNNIFIGYISVGESATESNRTWIGNTSTLSTWVGGNLLVGTRVNSTFLLDVNGTARVGSIRTGNFGSGDSIVFNTQDYSFSTVSNVLRINMGSGVNNKFDITNQGGNTAFRYFTGGLYSNFGMYQTDLFSNNQVASAILELRSNAMGFLPPRMTNAQRTAISSPAVGLIVYCTDATEGLYVYKSTGWTFII
jgi:hypothetical protein